MKIKLFTLSLILFSLTSYSQFSQYSFNGNADDGIGNYNGAVTGATITTNRFGLNSAAYSFNSTNKDHITVNPTPNIFGKPFGISVWFKALPNDSTPMSIVDWYACGYSTCLGDGIYGIALRNDRLYFQMRTDGLSPLYIDTSFSTTSTFDDDVWHHTVFTFDSTSGNIAIYIDNQVFKSINRPFSNINSVPTTSLVPLSIGRRDNSRVGQSLDHFNGKIDDISIYNEFLSAAKVDSLYNAFDTSSSLQCPNTYTLTSDTIYSCADTVSITLSGSDKGYDYSLWDTVKQVYAHGPFPGTGDSITFNVFDSSSVYQVVTDVNVSNSLDFDGSNDYVAIDNTSGFPMGNAARTMECWMKTTASGTSHRVMMDYGNRNVTNLRSSLQMSPTGKLYFSAYNNDLTGTIQVNDGMWHHVAVTHDGSTLKIYVDGVLDGTKSTTLATSGNSFKIGADDLASGEFFNGEITKVRIWNTDFDSTAINQLMNSCVSGDEIHLVVAYNFAQDSSSTLTDAAISSKNGILTNMDTINDWQISSPLAVSNTVVVIQHTLPSPNLGVDTSICSNASILLSPGNFVAYLWDDSTANSSLFIDGSITGAGNFNYYVEVTDTNGCKNSDTLNLTVNSTSTGTDVVTACISFKWIDGITYIDDNNTAMHTLINASGCDSVITLDLTINKVDRSVTSDGRSLTANSNVTSYQWLDCSTNNIISGDTNQIFIPSANGIYAAIFTQNGCTDTSDCYTITTVGISQFDDNKIKIYPNPSSVMLSVDLGEEYNNVDLTVRNQLGQALIKASYNNISKTAIDLSSLPKGSYILVVTTEKGKTNLNVIKN